MDVIFIVMVLYSFTFLFNFSYFTISFNNYSPIFVLVFYIIFFGYIFKLYDLQVASQQQKTINGIILSTVGVTISFLLTPKITPILPSNRLQIFIFFVGIFSGFLFWRLLYIHLFANKKFKKRVLLICDEHQAESITQDILNIDPHYHIVAYFSIDKNPNEHKVSDLNWISLKKLKAYLNENFFSEIVITTRKTDFITQNIYQILLKFLHQGVVIKEYEQMLEELYQKLPVYYFNVDFYKYFPFNINNQNKLYLFYSRLLDIIVSVIGLVFLGLILPFIVTGNLVGNRGSLFYKQKRVGKFGQLFDIVKLRTMVDRPETESPLFTQKNDHRITPFGNFLRRSRLDEVPQFWNVLKNDMALIGPRPERDVYVKILSETYPFYETRHIIKPGITGWAQVQYNYGSTFDDSLIKLQYDLFYIKHRTVLLDINILFKTFTTILRYKGQ